MTDNQPYSLCPGGHIGLYGTSQCTPAGCSCVPASAVEVRFKKATLGVVEKDEYPSPKRIKGSLGRPTHGTLNGRETRWRNELLLELGWTRPAHDGPAGTFTRKRWIPTPRLSAYLT